MLTAENLEILKEVAVETNKTWAARLGIPQSAAITCNKPSGTVSQLVDSSSGLHARHSEYYIRTTRADNKDPLTVFLKAAGVYNEPDEMAKDSTTVFFFAMKSPEGSLTRNQQTSLEALELWKTFQDHWCEHKPSVTVNVKEDEWFDVGAWVYKNFDDISGISFFPHVGSSFVQAPYTEVTKEEYEKFIKDHPMPEIDWDDLKHFEQEDNTTGSQELACVGNQCEIV